MPIDVCKNYIVLHRNLNLKKNILVKFIGFIFVYQVVWTLDPTNLPKSKDKIHMFNPFPVLSNILELGTSDTNALGPFQLSQLVLGVKFIVRIIIVPF